MDNIDKKKNNEELDEVRRRFSAKALTERGEKDGIRSDGASAPDGGTHETRQLGGPNFAVVGLFIPGCEQVNLDPNCSQEHSS